MLPRVRPTVDLDKLRSTLLDFNPADLNPIEEFQKTFAKQIGVTSAWAVHQGRAGLFLGLKV